MSGEKLYPLTYEALIEVVKAYPGIPLLELASKFEGGTRVITTNDFQLLVQRTLHYPELTFDNNFHLVPVDENNEKGMMF